MKTNYPIRLLMDNAWLPERDVVLERFRKLVMERPQEPARTRDDESEEEPSSNSEN